MSSVKHKTRTIPSEYLRLPASSLKYMYPSEITAWVNMKARCYNKNNPRYEDYGDRGIKVCDTWKVSFRYFIKDMGPKANQKLTLERMDNDGNYEPNNCKWATQREQRTNKRKRSC
jgi:hypothetical protein